MKKTVVPESPDRHECSKSRTLAETHASVADIAEKCGFANSSYFGKVFRQMMGCTPGAYRREKS